jgi:hypothetical protein
VHTTTEPASPLRTVGGAEAVRLAVVVGALGVVFGDIGTSPIYTIQTVFNPSDPHPVPITTDVTALAELRGLEPLLYLRKYRLNWRSAPTPFRFSPVSCVRFRFRVLTASR